MGAVRFILRRLASSVGAVSGVCLLAFFFVRIVPGDPVDNLTGGDATPEQRAEMRACMNLDKPVLTQLGIFARDIATGTLGRQCPDPKHSKPSVAVRIAAVLPYTAELAVAGVLVALMFALPLGMVAAMRRGTWMDAATSIVSLAGISIPVVWLGPLAIFVFFVKLAWLPGPGDADAPLALFLPAVVVGTHLMALLARMTRVSLLDVLDEDYVRTARAKGVAPFHVLVKHGLRNALLPVITVVGLQFGSLLGGATVAETVFARPGIGTLIYQAIRERNYPIIQGSVLVVAVMTVAVNLLVDVAYGIADPRIRNV